MKCYLCKSQAKLFITKNGYDIYVCPSCGLGATQFNREYKSFVKDHYSKGYFTGDPIKSAYVSYEQDKPYIIKNLSKFLSAIQKIKPMGKILDVGCAMGYFTEMALQKGYDAYGFDPSDFAAEQAKLLCGSERIKIGTISSVSYPPKSFDVLTLFDVFEHLVDPISDLRKLRTLLKDDGIIMIATGDANSVLARLLKRKWTFYNPPQHLFFFNQNTLTEVLKRTGVVPLSWFRVGKWLSLQYVLHLAGTSSESALARALYPLAKQSQFGRIPLYLPVGDNMVVIAKKSI